MEFDETRRGRETRLSATVGELLRTRYGSKLVELKDNCHLGQKCPPIYTIYT